MVVPPLANGSPDSTNLIFTYRYDDRSRLISKRLPGQDQEVVMEYDDLDRLISTTDPEGNVVYSLYDIFSRVTETGIMEGSVARPLETMHYDNYSGAPASVHSGMPFGAATNNTGRMTWRSSRSGQTGEWRDEVIYYDRKGRIIRSRRVNGTGGLTDRAADYTFDGLVVNESVKSHYLKDGTPVVWGTETSTSYWHNNMTKDIRLAPSVNNMPSGTVALAAHDYDEAGRLAAKRYHNNKFTTQYGYNTRGFITDMSTPGLFEMSLLYENVTAAPGAVACFNGNISAMTWRTGTAGTDGVQLLL